MPADLLPLPPGAPAHHHVYRHVDTMSFTWRHFKVWALSASGLMMGGYAFFMVGVVLPKRLRRWLLVGVIATQALGEVLAALAGFFIVEGFLTINNPT